MAISDAGATVLIPFITTAAGLTGVIVGSWLTDRREREKQRRDYITRQLSELYGPLLSLYKQVNARHRLRSQIHDAIHADWDDKKRTFMKEQGIDDNQMREMLKKELEKFQDHDVWNATPSYQKMVALLQDNLWLAEKSTRDHFGTVVAHVDSLNLAEEDAISFFLLDKLGFDIFEEPETEFNLRAFYTDIEEIHERLRTQLINKRSGIAVRMTKILHRKPRSRELSERLAGQLSENSLASAIAPLENERPQPHPP